MFGGDHCSERLEVVCGGLNPMELHWEGDWNFLASLWACQCNSTLSMLLDQNQKLQIFYKNCQCLIVWPPIEWSIFQQFHFYRTSIFYRAGDVFSIILAILHLTVTILPDTETKAKTLYGKVQAAALWAEALCVGKRRHVVHITHHIKLGCRIADV